MMLVITFAAMSALQPKIFLTKDYLISMLYLFPEYGLLAIAMMICMISGVLI